MIGYLFDVEFMWGFEARIPGFSKSPPSHLFPPPTTILGAISEPYAKRKNLSESKALEALKRLSQNLLSLCYRSINAIPVSFQDLNRVVAIGSRGGIKYPSAKYPYGSFDAPAVGKTTFSSIDNNPPTLRIMIVVDEMADVIEDDIWQVRRIGTKESLVSVVQVQKKTPEIVKGRIKTRFCFSKDSYTKITKQGNFIEQYFIEPYKLSENPPKAYFDYPDLVKTFWIGLPLFEEYFAEIDLKPGYVGYKIGEETGVGIESRN